MARGRPPRPPHLRLLHGNKGKRPPKGAQFQRRTAPLQPPKKLTKAQEEIWKRVIDSAWWLTDQDAPMAYIWVRLQADFQRGKKLPTAAMIGQMRTLSSELGLNSTGRARLGVDLGPPPAPDPAEKYMDDRDDDGGGTSA